MKENLTLYQQLMLEEILMYIGTQPYVIIASDNKKILDIYINEIQNRIEAIELLYDYPLVNRFCSNADEIKKILTVDYKNIILMDFDDSVEYAIQDSRYLNFNDNCSRNTYDLVVHDQIIWYNEFLDNASIVVPCSNRLSGDYIKDLHGFGRIWHLDDIKEQKRIYGSDEVKIKERIQKLRKIDHNAEYRDRIKNRLTPYRGRK